MAAENPLFNFRNDLLNVLLFDNLKTKPTKLANCAEDCDIFCTPIGTGWSHQCSHKYCGDCWRWFDYDENIRFRISDQKIDGHHALMTASIFSIRTSVT